MNKARIIFFGTPEFAAYILKGLIDNDYNVIACVCQPDKEVGRKKEIVFSATKKVALENNIAVYQPIKLRNDYQFILDLKPDMIITAAYGQIIPNEVLKAAKINSINVHGSLLPKHRGGAPIQRAIVNGDKKTGITIMQMIDKLDAGVMYAKEEVEIDEDINTTKLFEKLQVVGLNLLLKVLPDLLENKLEGIKQDENEATYSYNLTKEEEKIDFNKKSNEVHNLIRGMADTPGAYCFINDKKLKIYQTKLVDINDNMPVGYLKIIDKKHLLVKCADKYLEILTLQLEGKNKISAKDFINSLKEDNIILK